MHLNNFDYMAFCIGTLCRKYDFVKRILEKQIVFSLSLIVFIILFFCNINGYNDRLFWLIHWGLLPLSGIICCWQLFRYIFTKGRIINTLRYLGKHSLEIYILHFYFAFKLPEVGLRVIELSKTGVAYDITTALNIQLLLSVTMSCVICLLCILTFKILRFSNILSLIIFGRINK